MAKKRTRLEKNVAILKLAVLYGVPVKTIAIAVGCTRNAVSRRISKVREQLQAQQCKRIYKALRAIRNKQKKAAQAKSEKLRSGNAKPKAVVKSIKTRKPVKPAAKSIKQARKPARPAAKSIKQVRKPVKSAAKTVKRIPVTKKRSPVVKSKRQAVKPTRKKSNQ